MRALYWEVSHEIHNRKGQVRLETRVQLCLRRQNGCGSSGSQIWASIKTRFSEAALYSDPVLH